MEYLDIDKFATVINCMDGRIQIPVSGWIIENYDIDYPDTITEAGPIKLLSENKDKEIVASIKERMDISILKHHSESIFVVGHYDCAGNPQPKEKQLEQINQSIELIKKWNYPVKNIVGLWVNENWEVEKVFEWKKS
jgi:carbonic anhydrase